MVQFISAFEHHYTYIHTLQYASFEGVYCCIYTHAYICAHTHVCMQIHIIFKHHRQKTRACSHPTFSILMKELEFLDESLDICGECERDCTPKQSRMKRGWRFREAGIQNRKTPKLNSFKMPPEKKM